MTIVGIILGGIALFILFGLLGWVFKLLGGVVGILSEGFGYFLRVVLTIAVIVILVLGLFVL